MCPKTSTGYTYTLTAIAIEQMEKEYVTEEKQILQQCSSNDHQVDMHGPLDCPPRRPSLATPTSRVRATEGKTSPELALTQRTPS
jgi:hypothetical protein